jgi:acyl carrier protein
MTTSNNDIPPKRQELESIISDLVSSAMGRTLGRIERDDPLLSGDRGFDSFALMELVIGLEDTFDISMPDEDLDPDIFHSIATVASYVCTRLENKD